MLWTVRCTLALLFYSYPNTPLCEQQTTAGVVRNLNSDVVNVSAGDAITEAKRYDNTFK